MFWQGHIYLPGVVPELALGQKSAVGSGSPANRATLVLAGDGLDSPSNMPHFCNLFLRLNLSIL